MKFWLGVPEPAWLATLDAELMVSHHRLARRFRMPRARQPWVLDSGGFTELAATGEWHTTPTAYAAAVRRYRDEIGQMEWAAPQDWMCEPFIVARTGLTVAEHQARTVGNYLDLMAAAPDLPWLPVLQGYTWADYVTCVELYDAAGIDLERVPVVGLGSVCRRQATSDAARIVRQLAAKGLRLHGFGLKLAAVDRLAAVLASADSMAWSYRARNAPPLPGCTHRSCANCPRFALRWRAKVLRRMTASPLPFTSVDAVMEPEP